MFSHITVFLSFIYALAITHPLASLHEAIVARDRVRWSPLLLCWMAASLLLLTLNWLAIFRLAALPAWNVAQVLVHILAAVTIYFTCAFPAIRSIGEAIDMPAYFERQRVPIMVSFLVFGCAAVLVNVVDAAAQGAGASATAARVAPLLPTMVAVTVGLAFRARWVQWIVAAFVLTRLGYVLIARLIAA